MAAAKTELENRQKGAAPKIEALYAALSDGKWPQILSAAEAVLDSVPEHPAARQARSRAWQQIAAIGPVAAAQWPHRGRPLAQAAAMIGPGSGTEHEPAGPGAAETDGIVWLKCCRQIRKRRPGRRGSGPVGNAGSRDGLCSTGRHAAQSRCRRDRWPVSRRPAPRAGFSSGSMPSAAISSAWTTTSSWAEPGLTAMLISR